MTRRRALLGAALAAAIVGLWWWARPDPRPTPPAAAGNPASVPGNTAPPQGKPVAAPGEESRLADGLNAVGGSIESDLRIVLGLIEAFRLNFPREGNPVGSNAEITASLQGRNAAGVVLLPRAHPAVNVDGELCDRWGTPFFFHAESARRMEVRSAGPDRRLWTDDDVVLAP
jgi:hypothetical protein